MFRYIFTQLLHTNTHSRNHYIIIGTIYFSLTTFTHTKIGQPSKSMNTLTIKLQLRVGYLFMLSM